MPVNITSPNYPGDYWVAEVSVSAYDAIQDVFLIHHPDLVTIDQWCEETFGPSDMWGEDRVTGWKRMYKRYYFSNTELLNMFALRWS